MIELNDLLIKEGIDPDRVMVMRHRPTAKELRDVLPWLAEEDPGAYNAYQSQHGERVEVALSKATHLVSCVGREPGKAMFVGLYTMNGFKKITQEAFWAKPDNKRLAKHGTHGPMDRSEVLWFDLRLTKRFESMRGRLILRWPGIERSWWRWAVRNNFAVDAICEESRLIQRLPEWESLTLDWHKLQVLPASWRQALSQWRGIYYIFDKASSKGYVGSASGRQNILGRWLNYAATGHGGNRLLRACDPANFVFSILQRVSPDMDPGEIGPIESSWKERLHTRAPTGLNDN